MSKQYMRYHRYDQNNVKYIKRFELNEIPPVSENGFTEWVRGTGQHSAVSLNNIVNGVRKACLGVPKSDEQKLKMSLAKLGKPKSTQHKESMRRAWEHRKQQQLQDAHEKTNNTLTT
jgi:hypothetical protein